MALATQYNVTAENRLAGIFPLNHPRIQYDNIFRFALSFVEEFSTGTVSNALKPNTWEKWRFSGSNSVTASFTTPFEMDSVCIGAHNLQGSLVVVSYTIGVNTVTMGTKSPTSNSPLFFHLPERIGVDSIIIAISGAGNKEVGFVSAGVALQMERPIFNGHVPITDGDATQYYSNRTESGEIIGQQIRRQGFETSADFQNINDVWYRKYFAPFKQHAKTGPFFFAWNLLEYPDDVGFCRIAQDINSPMQNGTVTKRSISMNLLGAG